MQTGVRVTVWVAALLCLAGFFGQAARAQDYDDLTAKQRILPNIGPGLRAVKKGLDGRLYVLASPSPGLSVYDAAGKLLFSVGPGTPQVGHAAITFGEDCDADAHGWIYVADRGANLLLVFSATGELVRTVPVRNPIGVAALPDGEVAVTTTRDSNLVTVFDQNGRDIRDFGSPDELTERADLNRFLNIGQIASDASGRLLYAFDYFPEPTVRQFDRHGYAAGEDIVYTEPDALTTAIAVRREIERQEKKGDPPVFKPVVTALGVDRDTGAVWLAEGDTLYRFDRDGNHRGSYLMYTQTGARVVANTILVEKDKLIVGGDPIGIYEFDQPGKQTQP